MLHSWPWKCTKRSLVACHLSVETVSSLGILKYVNVGTQELSTHLTGVQPVLQLGFVFDSRQQQPVHYVLTNGRQDGQTESDAQQHKKSREMFDAHLQGL